MEKKCFVIMPFSKTVDGHDEEYWTVFFETLKRIMEENDYCCTRSEVGPYKLFENIVKNIENSDVVIAVLTDLNANVWYELGIRHTLKTGTIMLMQEGQKVPFDIRDFGIIFYKDSIGLEQKLRQSLKEYLNKIDERTSDSPVISVLNNKIYNNLEKKLEEMQQLIWRLIDEIPRGKNIIEKEESIKNKVLWVDDFPTNNQSIISLFEDKNVHFDIAINTNKGLELYERETYDMIITDMGRGNEADAGISLLKRLNSLHCKIPVIVYTSYWSKKKYGDEAYRLGAYAVVIGVGNIISVISDVLGL